MRVTKLMGLAVLVVALAVVINTLALTSATVTNTFTLDVTNTNSALLSISQPASPDSDLTIDDTGEKFSLEVEDGIQADATYVFGNTITITNRSDDALTITYTTDNPSGNVTVSLLNSVGGANINNLSLSSGASVTATMTIATTAAATAANSKTSLNIVGTK